MNDSDIRLWAAGQSAAGDRVRRKAAEACIRVGCGRARAFALSEASVGYGALRLSDARPRASEASVRWP